MTSANQPKPDVMSDKCPSRVILNHVTSQWGVLVLIALQTQTLRYSELRRMIDGVSERMLSQTLKTLEADGFVNRKSYNVVPPHVEYSLTSHGQDVAVHVSALAQWVESNLMDLKPFAGSPSVGRPDIVLGEFATRRL